jgi:hypothetical protein
VVKDLQRWRLVRVCDIVTEQMFGEVGTKFWTLRDLDEQEFIKCFSVSPCPCYCDGPWNNGTLGIGQFIMDQCASWHELELGSSYQLGLQHDWCGTRLEIIAAEQHRTEMEKKTSLWSNITTNVHSEQEAVILASHLDSLVLAVLLEEPEEDELVEGEDYIDVLGLFQAINANTGLSKLAIMTNEHGQTIIPRLTYHKFQTQAEFDQLYA